MVVSFPCSLSASAGETVAASTFDSAGEWHPGHLGLSYFTPRKRGGSPVCVRTRTPASVCFALQRVCVEQL